MNYTTLGIVMHSKCNAQCDICSESCSPARQEKLDKRRLKEIIDSFVGTSITKIAFTGGEPFLEYDNLIELITYSKSKGFMPTVVTNGYWASSDEKTEKIVKQLSECGLARMNISYDHYHKVFVSQDNINRLVKQCIRYRLPYVITVVKLKNEMIGDVIDDFSVENGLVHLLIAPCEPAGRAKEKFDQERFIRNKSINGLVCPYDGIITINADGNIYPCCAHQVFESNLSVGNYKDLEAAEILSRLKNNGLLYILRNYGLDPILEMKPSVKQKLPDYVSSPCEICEMLFTENISQYRDQVISFINEHMHEDEKV